MDRRSFLRKLGFGTVAAAAAATTGVDIEKLLWEPGEKTILLPDAPKFVSLDIEAFGFDNRNAAKSLAEIIDREATKLVTPEWVTKQTVAQMENNLRVFQQLDRQWGGEVGQTLNIRKPQRYEVLKVGDVFTVEGQYKVNPLGPKDLQQFVVTAEDVSRDALAVEPYRVPRRKNRK